MFERSVDFFFQMLDAVPAILTEPGSPNFHLARAMIGLIVIALIAYILAFLPYRRWGTWLRQLFSR
ncbi:MAG: hypothetical protein HXY30_00440 [Pseudorhodoplanes sp.]|nr:hypothetical protein [Pseudorhodoplanes sp.]